MASCEKKMIPLEAISQTGDDFQRQTSSKDLVDAKVPSRPRRRVVIVAGVIAVLTVIVAASLIGKYVPDYLKDTNSSSEKGSKDQGIGKPESGIPSSLSAAISPSELTETKSSTEATLREQGQTSPPPRMTSITSTATIGSISEAQTMKSKVSGPVLASSVADQTVISNISTKTAAISPSELAEIKPSTTTTLRDYKQALTSPLPRMASITSTAIIGGMSEAPTMKPKVSGPVLASSAADQTVIANLSTNTAASSSIGTETKPSAKATSSNFHQGQTMSLPRMTSLTSAAATSGMNEVTSIMSTMSGIRLASSVADVAVIANLVPNTESKWSRWSSWTDCTKTCGTGTRQRNRTCDAINQTAVFAPISCAGKAQQVKSCAEWSCPDCNRTCIKGTLNDECDACTCDDHVLTGRVLSETNVPLPEANISLAETPYRVLAQTNISGYFTAFNVCTDVQQELFISKAGFVPTKKNATSLTLTTANVVAKLEIAVPPFVTIHPESKMRMPGQSVTFCCEGEGNPPPEIEWFKENNIIDKDLYSYNNTLLIPAVDNGLSGTYRCRVVNDFGSEFSDRAVLKVLDKEKDSCSPIPNSKNVTLPDGCVTRVTNSSSVDVGECEPVACLRNDSTFNSSCQDPSFCCGPRDVKYVLIDCGDIMSFNLSKVTRCSCGGCTEKVTIVNGIVVGGSEEKPIKYGDVIYGGEVVAYTDGEGRFSLTIPQKVKRAIVTFQDFDQEFEERTKVFVLNEGSTAFHKIKLKSVPAPITFNASEPIDIPLGSDPNNGSFADLELSEGSFLTEDGSVFQGNAKATISVTDSRNLSDVLTAPGDFTTTDEEGEAEILETYGMVKLKFEDKSGKPLAMSKPMKVYLDPQKLNLTVQNANDVPLKLYWLDKKTERWREVGNFQLGDGSKRRRKRSNRIFFVGTVTPAIAQEKLNFDLPAVRVAVRVTTDPYPRTPNGADVLVRVIRQEYGFYRGYIEETTSAEGLVCIPIWRDKTCHIQAETNGKYMIPTRIDDLPPNIEAQPRSDDVNGDIQWIEFKSELGETSNNPTPMYKHIPAEVAKCKSPQVRPEGSQFTFQEPPTVSDFSILNNNDINWVNRGCYIKIKVNGENAIFAAESYKEDDTGETGKIGWHIRMSRTVTAGGSNIVCLQFSCPIDGAYTYLKVAPLTRQCTFRAGSVHDDLSRVQYPHCPNEFTRSVCPVQPPAIRGQEKWLWIPLNGAAQTSYGTFSHPRFGDFRCLAGDQDYIGPSPTRVTEDGYALIYDCS